MNFQDRVLEKIVRRWKWTRNNTILLFEKSQKEGILDYTSTSKKKSKYYFQPLLYQFQCILTTTDTYYRKLSKAKNTQYAVLVEGNKIIPKKEIPENMITKTLKDQMVKVENLLKLFSYKEMDSSIKDILTISDHEYLHQGQMIIDFREVGVDLPERFRKSWAL